MSDLRSPYNGGGPGKFQPRLPRFRPQTTKRTGPGNPDRCAWGSLILFLLLVVAFRAFLPPAFSKASEPVQDLVGPEPLEPVQRLVQGREFVIRDAADLLNGLDVLLIESVDDAADFLALRCQADADRATIDARALMIEEAEFDKLLEIIGDVGA